MISLLKVLLATLPALPMKVGKTTIDYYLCMELISKVCARGNVAKLSDNWVEEAQIEL